MQVVGDSEGINYTIKRYPQLLRVFWSYDENTGNYDSDYIVIGYNMVSAIKPSEQFNVTITNGVLSIRSKLPGAYGVSLVLY